MRSEVDWGAGGAGEGWWQGKSAEPASSQLSASHRGALATVAGWIKTLMPQSQQWVITEPIDISRNLSKFMLDQMEEGIKKTPLWQAAGPQAFQSGPPPAATLRPAETYNIDLGGMSNRLSGDCSHYHRAANISLWWTAIISLFCIQRPQVQVDLLIQSIRLSQMMFFRSAEIGQQNKQHITIQHKDTAWVWWWVSHILVGVVLCAQPTLKTVVGNVLYIPIWLLYE